MPYTHRYLLCLRASSVQTWNLESIIYINNRATNTSTWQFQCAITKVCYRKGLLSQTAGGCQFSSIKLQKLENPFALCTLPGVRSPVPLAVSKSEAAHVLTGVDFFALTFYLDTVIPINLYESGNYTMSFKKLCKIVFVRTSSNVH